MYQYGRFSHTVQCHSRRDANEPGPRSIARSPARERYAREASYFFRFSDHFPKSW
jgi:hypothetical protein